MAMKLVGETGFAPAWAFAREFLRLVCIRSTTRRKKSGAAGATCRFGKLKVPSRVEGHAHAPGGAAVFKTARSPVPRTAARIGRGGRWSEAERRTSRCGARPRAKRVNGTRRRSAPQSYGGQAGTGIAQRVLRPSCLLISPRREEIGADEGSCTPSGLAPDGSSGRRVS
jgi:hypothetical protein